MEAKFTIRNLYELAHGRVIKFDGRTRQGKSDWKYFKKHEQELRAEARIILELREERRKNRHVFKNILQNSLYLDYRENKKYCEVYPDHIRIGRRNHWASTNEDKLVLKVLNRK